MQSKSVRILLVDDDDVDAMAVERGFRQAKIANELVRARDGLEALGILRGQGAGGVLEKPYIIFLDLNMPRMGGFEFLKELRSDPQLAQDVVFVLTTSKADEDRSRAYDQFVAGYVVKAQAGKEFLSLIEMIDHYWRVVELPF
jgi:CheY-like chemotaxis protein